MKTAKEIWFGRNPCHDLDDNGVDRFYKTMEMCMKEYAKQAIERCSEVAPHDKQSILNVLKELE